LNLDGVGSICHPVLHNTDVEFQKMNCNRGPELVIEAIAKVPVYNDASEAGPGHPSRCAENAKVFYPSS
jgi:hypothetical protein